MGAFATGVTVVTTAVDGELYASPRTRFTSVSLEPMLVLVCLHRLEPGAASYSPARMRSASTYWQPGQRTCPAASPTAAGPTGLALRRSRDQHRSQRLPEHCGLCAAVLDSGCISDPGGDMRSWSARCRDGARLELEPAGLPRGNYRPLGAGPADASLVPRAGVSYSGSRSCR